MPHRTAPPLKRHATLELTAPDNPIATQFNFSLSHGAHERRTKLRRESREPNSRIQTTFAQSPRAYVEVGVDGDTHLDTRTRRVSEKLQLQARISHGREFDAPNEFGSPRKSQNFQRAPQFTGERWPHR